MERIKWIDNQRGLLISLVVLAHSMVPFSLFSVLSYLIGSFLFISGFLYNVKRPILILIKKRFFQLIIPYYFMGAINLIIAWLVKNYITDISFKRDSVINFLIVNLKVGDVPQNVIPLWYLPMFFFSEIIFSIFQRLKLLPLLTALWVITLMSNNLLLPFELNIAALGTLFIYIGYLYKCKLANLKQIKKNTHILFFSISIFGLIYISKINGAIDLSKGYYGKNPLYMILGEVLFILFSFGLANLLSSHKITLKYFEILGKNTIFILGYHILLGLPIYAFFDIFSDPLKLIRRYWYIYFVMIQLILFMIIKFIPEKLKSYFTGIFKN